VRVPGTDAQAGWPTESAEPPTEAVPAATAASEPSP
jgi:hypothetical protein